MAWAIVRDRDQTDDVMQAAYEKAYRSLDTRRSHPKLSQWVNSVAPMRAAALNSVPRV